MRPALRSADPPLFSPSLLLPSRIVWLGLLNGGRLEAAVLLADCRGPNPTPGATGKGGRQAGFRRRGVGVGSSISSRMRGGIIKGGLCACAGEESLDNTFFFCPPPLPVGRLLPSRLQPRLLMLVLHGGGGGGDPSWGGVGACLWGNRLISYWERGH